MKEKKILDFFINKLVDSVVNIKRILQERKYFIRVFKLEL